MSDNVCGICVHYNNGRCRAPIPGWCEYSGMDALVEYDDLYDECDSFKEDPIKRGLEGSEASIADEVNVFDAGADGDYGDWRKP